jgi:hypothetical protein
VEGAVLDFWKLDMLRLPTRQVTVGLRQAPRRSCSAALRSTFADALRGRLDGEIAARTAGGKLSQDKKSPLLGSGRVAHREPVCAGKLSGIGATVADVFQPARQETECGPIFVNSYGDMISHQAGVFSLKSTESEPGRHRKVRTALGIRRLSGALWKYAQQAGRLGLEPLRMRGLR